MSNYILTRTGDLVRCDNVIRHNETYGGRKVKYIKKIQKPGGGCRYIYDPEELNSVIKTDGNNQPKIEYTPVPKQKTGVNHDINKIMETAKINEGTSKSSTKKNSKDIDAIVNKVIKGDFGNGQTRKDKLKKAGYDYNEIQNLVNERLGSSKRHDTKQTDDTSSDAETTNKSRPAAKKAGSVKKTNSADKKTDSTDKKTDSTKKADSTDKKTSAKQDEVVDKVIRGAYGNGQTRKAKLKKAGYDYNEIQDLVNKRLRSNNTKKKSKSSTTKKKSKSS